MESEADNERRVQKRRKPKVGNGIAASTVVPPIPLTDVEVLDVSSAGIAIRTRVPLKPGDRMSFRIPAQGLMGLRADLPAPILAEVLACEAMDDGFYRVRCRALLGAFEAA